MIKKIKKWAIIAFSIFVFSTMFASPIHAEYQWDVIAIASWLSDYVIIELQKDKTYATIDEFIDAVCDIPIKNENNESPVIKSAAEMKPYRESAKAYFKYKAEEEGVSTQEILEKINNGYGNDFAQIMGRIEDKYLDVYTQWIANDDETLEGPITNTIVNEIKEVKYASIEEWVKAAYPDGDEYLKVLAYLHDTRYVSKKKLDAAWKQYVESNADEIKDAKMKKLFSEYGDFINSGGKFAINQEYDGINDSQSMATGDMYAEEDLSAVYEIASREDEAESLESALCGLLVGIGNSLNALAESCDASIDRLIYGRIRYYGTNYFSFELVKANPYGIVGGTVYKLFRTVALPLILVLLLFHFSKMAWSKGSGEVRRNSIDNIGRCVLMTLFLFLMPVIIDALIAFKDILLNYTSTQLSSELSGLFGTSADDENTIIGFYKKNADSGFLLDGLLYLGATGIIIFYLVTYASTAVSVMVDFMIFPLMVIFSFTDKKMVESWFKTMIGNIFTPLLDSVLLLMPLMLNNMLSSNNDVKAYLLTFIACYSVIPSRAIIRNRLGVGGSVGSEMLGFGAMMGTMRMLGGLKRRVGEGVKGAIETGKEVKRNHDLANMYGDLARANGEGGQLTGRFGKLGKNGGKLSSVEEKDKAGLESLGGPGDKKDDVANDEVEQKNGLQNQNGTTEAPELQSLEDGTEGNEQADGVVVNNGNEQAPNLDSTGETSNEEQQEQGVPIAASVANNKEDIANTGVEGARSPAEQQAIDKNNILKSYANTGNFENKEFANAFNFAERAKLHKQKANRAMVHGIASSVGGTAGGIAGGVAGAAILGGATMFAGGNFNAVAASAGANLGSSVGSWTGSAATNAIAYAGMSDPVQRTIRKTAPAVGYAYNTALSNLEGAMSVNAQRTGIGSSASFIAKSNEYDMKARMHQNNMNNASYDGYYSRNAQYDASQTQANPSNLNNFGQYDPHREMEQQRRQQEYEARMNHYANREASYGGYDYSYDNSSAFGRVEAPVPTFESADDVLNVAGLDTNAFNDYATNIFDAFSDTGSQYHDDVMQEFHRMQASYIEREEAKPNSSLSKVPAEKREEAIRKLKESVAAEHRVTIASQMFMNQHKERFGTDEQYKNAKDMIYKHLKANRSNYENKKKKD